MDAIRAMQPTRVRPTKPTRRYFMRDGRPAVQCERCEGTGNVTHGRDPWMDYPCPARCEDGLIPAHGLNAAVLLGEDALHRLTHDGAESAVEYSIPRLKALIEQIQDIMCAKCEGDETEPRGWR